MSKWQVASHVHSEKPLFMDTESFSPTIFCYNLDCTPSAGIRLTLKPSKHIDIMWRLSFFMGMEMVFILQAVFMSNLTPTYTSIQQDVQTRSLNSSENLTKRALENPTKKLHLYLHRQILLQAGWILALEGICLSTREKHLPTSSNFKCFLDCKLEVTKIISLAHKRHNDLGFHQLRNSVSK